MNDQTDPSDPVNPRNPAPLFVLDVRISARRVANEIPSRVELSEVMIEMLRLELARELAAHRPEARIDWPLAADGPGHEPRDQLPAPRPLRLEVVLLARDGAP